MNHIDGNDNYTIEGNNSHIGDLTQNIDTVNIYNGHNNNNNNDGDDNQDEEELEPFFDMGIPKTPDLNFIFGYLFLVIFIGVNYLKFKYSFSFQIYILILIVSGIGLYWIYSLFKTKFVDCIHIKENEVVRGQASYPYNLIRVDDIDVSDGIITLPFTDDTQTVTFNMKDDAAGLLRHKIREYHQFYNKRKEK